IPGQQIWLRSLTVAPRGEIVGVIVRTPPSIRVAYDPTTGRTWEAPELPVGKLMVSGDFLYAQESPGLAVFDAELRRTGRLLPAELAQDPPNTYPAGTTLWVMDPDAQGRLWGCG